MDVIEAILNRKSIRYFQPYTIPQQEVKLLLECARFAPSGGNRQPWEFLVVDNKEEIKQIYDFGWEAYGGGHNVCRFGDASLLVFFLGGAQCYLAAENLALAAYGLGYGSCMIGGFDRKRTQDLLNIPEKKRILLFVAVGLADEERSNQAKFTASGERVADMLPDAPELRKSLDDLVHHGRYGTRFMDLGEGSSREQVVGGFKKP
jgi:nitroreductase